MYNSKNKNYTCEELAILRTIYMGPTHAEGFSSKVISKILKPTCFLTNDNSLLPNAKLKELDVKDKENHVVSR